MSSSQWTSVPREFPTSGFELLDPDAEIEEETLVTYEPEKYYSVQQGEIFNDRYQTIAKLGYGVTSTVWFSRDLIDSKFVVLKVYVAGEHRHRELEIYEHFNCIETNHPGKKWIRLLLDHFIIKGPHGSRICLVHEPLGLSADVLMMFLPNQSMDLESMKRCLRQLLVSLDFLHCQAKVVHTDLQLRNLLLPAPDEKTLASYEEQILDEPLPRKVLKDRTIYKSSGFPPSNGLLLLTDFGEARFGIEDHDEDIMPNQYRAPEVILKGKWDFKVDIWNAAMVAWEIVSPRPLFDGRNADGIFDDRVHLAEMVALLGPPPAEFRARHKLSSVFWDDAGNWKGLVPIPDITLEKLGADIEGEDKEGFFRWIRSALQWNPEDRPTAEEMVYDEWCIRGIKVRSKEQNPETNASNV